MDEGKRQAEIYRAAKAKEVFVDVVYQGRACILTFQIWKMKNMKRLSSAEREKDVAKDTAGEDDRQAKAKAVEAIQLVKMVNE